MTHNSIKNYDLAMAGLRSDPGDITLQHQAVLTLARAGSLDFAWTEFQRYGLDEITALQDTKLLEDIMGLAGRLLKDLFLTTSGKTAKDYALQSAEKYEAAFQITRGFYSGINAATMGLMGNMPDAIITSRAKEILRILPPPETPDKETLYFIEATRAEALLLLGDAYKARAALRVAVQHDPQNYTAHASTLRQFEMILDKRGVDKSWLSSFSPPKPIHYAGHLFAVGDMTQDRILSQVAQNILKIDISDAIQAHDIGFGYGSLAAGADILIAEVLIDEGCSLHVTLPVSMDVFIARSVEPYGTQWVERIQNCWDAATSREIVTGNSIWPHAKIDRYSGNIAMGKAISQATQLSVDAMQLLVWNGIADDIGTGRNAADWADTKRAQIVVPYAGQRQTHIATPTNSTDVTIRATLCQHSNDEIFTFTSLYEAVSLAISLQKENEHTVRLGIQIGIGPEGGTYPDIARQLAGQAVPGSTLVTEAAASFLRLNHADEFVMDYRGRIGGDKESVRAFALKHKG